MSTTGRPGRRSAEDETRHWLTRAQSAELLDVAERKLDEWTRAGELHPRRVVRANSQGRRQEHVLFDPRELYAVQAKYPSRKRSLAVALDPGVVASRAFAAFAQGATDADVVIQACVTLDKVRELRQQWIGAVDRTIMLTEPLREQLETSLGVFRTPHELVEKIEQALDRAYAAGVEQGKPAIEVDETKDERIANASDEQIERGILAALDAADTKNDHK